MTIVLEVDPTLKEVEWNDKYYPRPKIKDSVEKLCLSRDAIKRDWVKNTITATEIVFASSVPHNADLYHQNYLGYLSTTYNNHYNVVMAPQHFWYTILCEIAQTVVGAPETHRSLFTRDPAGKIDIIVPCASEVQPLRMESLLDEMIGFIPVDTSLFMPNFSTETEMSKLAALAAFLETCSPYYNYGMLCCGHPQVKLTGTIEDWDKVTASLEALMKEFDRCDSPLTEWIGDNILPVADKIRSALKSNDGEWFRSIFSEERCGSGGQTQVDGWFSRLFMKQPKGIRELGNFATHVSKVPYTTYPSSTKWNMCFGLFHSNRDTDGFMVPEFSWVQVKKLSNPLVKEA